MKKKDMVSADDVRRTALERVRAAQGKRQSRDGDDRPNFDPIVTAVAKASLAHREEDEDAKEVANAAARVELAELGIASVSEPFESRTLKGVVTHIQRQILDPNVRVPGTDVRIPLGSLRALQNVVDVPEEQNGAMHALVKQRYDTTGLLLRAQGMLADVRGEDPKIFFNPKGLEWVVDQLRSVADLLKEAEETLDDQRLSASYASMADKVEATASRIFGGNAKDAGAEAEPVEVEEAAFSEADVSDETKADLERLLQEANDSGDES